MNANVPLTAKIAPISIVITPKIDCSNEPLFSKVSLPKSPRVIPIETRLIFHFFNVSPPEN